MRGGRREGAGRKRGSAAKKSRRFADEAAEHGEMPLEYMLRVMRDEQVPRPERSAMALAAAQYCHPKLTAVAVHTDQQGSPVEQTHVTTVNIIGVASGTFVSDTEYAKMRRAELPPLLEGVAEPTDDELT